jgi:hypothetical protein
VKHKPQDDLNTIFGEAIQRLEENPDALTSTHIGALVSLAQSYNRQSAVAYFTRVLVDRGDRVANGLARSAAPSSETRSLVDRMFRRGPR